jgi:hypothetical protein
VLLTRLSYACLLQAFRSSSNSAVSRSQVMHWSWRTRRPHAAAPTCAAPTWLARAALLQGRELAASAAESAEWPGTAAPPARTPTGGLGIGVCAGRWGAARVAEQEREGVEV